MCHLLFIQRTHEIKKKKEERKKTGWISTFGPKILNNQSDDTLVCDRVELKCQEDRKRNVHMLKIEKSFPVPDVHTGEV